MPATNVRAIPSPGPPGPPPASPAAGRAPLDLNTATATELDALPGIGPVLAARIVQHRREHGPFRSVDELLSVPGIGARRPPRRRPGPPGGQLPPPPGAGPFPEGGRAPPRAGDRGAPPRAAKAGAPRAARMMH